MANNNKITANDNNTTSNQYLYSCEVLIDFRTCLCPSPKKSSSIMQINKAEAKIEKICSEKIIIGGVLHKTIIYTDITQDDCDNPNFIKCRDIPFSCYVDAGSTNPEDSINIVSCEIICTFSEVIKKEDCCFEESILVEKDIIRVVVQKASSSTQSAKAAKYKARHTCSHAKRKSCHRCSR